MLTHCIQSTDVCDMLLKAIAAAYLIHLYSRPSNTTMDR